MSVNAATVARPTAGLASVPVAPRVRASDRRLRDRARGPLNLLRMVRTSSSRNPRSAARERRARRRRGPRGEGALADRHRASPPLRPGAHARLAPPPLPPGTRGHPPALINRPTLSRLLERAIRSSRSSDPAPPRPARDSYPPPPRSSPSTHHLTTTTPDQREPLRRAPRGARHRRRRAPRFGPVKGLADIAASSARPCARSNPRSGAPGGEPGV